LRENPRNTACREDPRKTCKEKIKEHTKCMQEKQAEIKSGKYMLRENRRNTQNLAR
jgi:hypothetical protein